MFNAERWAEAFVKVCGEHLEKDAAATFDKAVVEQCHAGTSVLKTAHHALMRMNNSVSGSTAAAQFNGFLRSALQKCGYTGEESGIEAACATVFLLIQRDMLKSTHLLIDAIEDLTLKRRNILTVALDCAEKPDDGFVEDLKKTLKEREGVNEVRVTVVLMPELLGGYRVNFGDYRQDFSILGQMKQLEQALACVQ
jgi:F0F1-type ATP synthase delta subunit